jgi:hypothetical protein
MSVSRARETLGELRRLAPRINQAWKRHGYEYLHFPDIVLELTGSLDFAPLGELHDVCKLLDDPDIAALQATNTFSYLYLKLYDNGRFWVEVLNWWNSDINIHDHDFSAVQFQARGRSLNVRYTFEEHAEIADVKFGQISVAGAEVWEQGDRSITLPGSPHTVKHLSVPTVSILIRTYPRASYGPQHNYFPPGVVASYNVANDIFRKRLKALRLLSGGSTETFHAAFRDFIGTQGLAGSLFTLIKMVDIIFAKKHVNLINEFAKVYGDLSERLVEAAVFYRASELLLKSVSLPPNVTDAERLVLATMSCAFDSDSLRAILRGLESETGENEAIGAVCSIASRLTKSDALIVKNAMELLGLNEGWPQITASFTA